MYGIISLSYKKEVFFMQNLCLRIRALREDREPKTSQTDIANLLGISQQYYSQYERGVRPLPIEHLIKLCIFYGVSSDYILGLPYDLKRPKR